MFRLKQSVTSLGLALVPCLGLSPAWANDLLATQEHQVTFDANGHSTPMIAYDPDPSWSSPGAPLGNYIVYSQYPVVNGTVGNASVYYQQVGSNGAPIGAPVVVADSPENQWLNAASGGNIVYTLSPSLGAYGDIVLYSTATGSSRNLTSSGDSWSPRIHSTPIGPVTVWTEAMPNGSGQTVAYIVNSGVPVQTSVVGGPIPSASMANVGDRFIVWSALVNGQNDLAAYDMQQGVSFVVANDPTVNEQNATTEGPWIVYEAATATETDILAINEDTAEHRLIVANGALNLRPEISGDWISYESNVQGNSQIFIYNLDKGETFQVTNNSNDEHLNDLYCDDLTHCIVTYIDNRNGNDGVFDTSLNLIPIGQATPLPAALPLFATGLGGLGLLGWRRKRKTQAAVA